MKNQVNIQNVELPNDPTQIVELKIKGITPLIMHKFSAKVIKELEDKKMGKGKKGREKCDPEQEYKDAMHVCEDGKYGFPAHGFKLAMVRAGKNLGHKMTDARTSFLVLADDNINQYIVINGKPEMRTDWVRVGNGGADVRYRPMFREWNANIRIKFNPNFISVEQLATMLRDAGSFVGIGESRPEVAKGMTFGTFEIVNK